MAEKNGDVQMDDRNGDGSGNEEALVPRSELTAVQSTENGQMNGISNAAMETEDMEIGKATPMELPKLPEDLEDPDLKSAFQPNGAEEPVDLSMAKTGTVTDDQSSKRREGLRKNPAKCTRLNSNEFVKPQPPYQPRASTRPESSALSNEPRKRGRKPKPESSSGRFKRAKTDPEEETPVNNEQANAEPNELNLADQTQVDQLESVLLPNENGLETKEIEEIEVVGNGPPKTEDGNERPPLENGQEKSDGQEKNGGQEKNDDQEKKDEFLTAKEEETEDNAFCRPMTTRSGRKPQQVRAPVDSSGISAQAAAKNPKKRPKRQPKKIEDEAGIFQAPPPISQQEPATLYRKESDTEISAPAPTPTPSAHDEASAQSQSINAQSSIPKSEAPPSEPPLYKIAVSSDSLEPQKFAYVSGHKPDEVESEPDLVDGSPSSTGNRSVPAHPHPCQLPFYEFKNIREFMCAMCDRHMHDTKPSYVIIRLPTCEDCAANRCFSVQISDKNENENE